MLLRMQSEQPRANMIALDPIASFVTRYRREYDFYYEVARLVSQECDALAAENGIKAIVTFRAKSPDRLEGKIRQRSSEKRYQTEEDIRADIVDLSGVRIALYFPGDRAKIAALLQGTFIVDQEKKFPDKDKAPGQRFDGYHAEHYRVRLNPDVLSEAQRRYGDSLVEVQVASVLMHAWSEVEHDLNYKQLSGQLSQEEQTILDGINGIVLSGEIFLERLQAAFEARVSRSGSPFTNQYELAAFLFDHLRAAATAEGQPEPVLGRIDILFRLLQLAGSSSPEGLAPYLQSLDAETEPRPLADRVIDRVLASRSDLYEHYFEVRRAAGGGARTFLIGKDQPAPETVGVFLQRWIVVERFMRALMTKGRLDRRFNFSSSAMARRLGFPANIQMQLDVLRRIRNNLVHGIQIPEQDLLNSAANDLGEIIDALTVSEDADVREAMRWARSDEPVDLVGPPSPSP